MPSDPRAASSSSAARPSSSSSKPSSSSAKPSGSSSSDPKKASSSSSSSSRPSSSSSSGGSSSSSSAAAKPTQPTANISANAWMSFFLFVCLVLIILQGPLGLSGTGAGLTSMSGFGFGLSGLPGCGGYVAAAVPWCAAAPAPVAAMPYAPMAPMAPIAPVMPVQAMYQVPQPQVVVHAPPRYPSPQMGGQGYVANPQGGGGYSWYANPYLNQGGGYRRPAPPVSVQYQRPGMQVQVETGMLCWYFPYACQPLIPYAYARDSPPKHTYDRPYNAAEYSISPVPGGRGPQVQVQHQGPAPLPVQPVAPMSAIPPASPEFVAGLANLESAFYPLLVGAIALLVIFDYAS